MSLYVTLCLSLLMAGGSSRSSPGSRGAVTTAPVRNSTAAAATDSRPRAKTSALQVVGGNDGADALKSKALHSGSAIVLSRQEAVDVFRKIDANQNGEISQVCVALLLRAEGVQ